MFLKKESSFQYHPGIEKIIEDIQGGGTISRADLITAVFTKGTFDELPPLCLVSKDSNGLWHVVKTASVQAIAAADAVVYRVKKNHLFAVGEVVTLGGSLAKAAVTITAIDKSNAAYDSITVDATMTAAVVGNVLVLANAAAAAGSAALKYVPQAITMNKVDITVANQLSGLLVRGTVNESVMPFPVDAALKAYLSFIRFV